ncbi:hypothetical protein [Ottowia thiooxydans]|uniref:hypothetical protein n=1 Tax=Ottowia thiooxydans TaxID=219182 RepID=UPI0004252D60|nr:hypothetical protein [Ottowia thiooxydans]
MAAAHALLLLTLMADGSTRLTLSEATTAKDCETSRISVTRVLTSMGKPPLLALCGQSDLRLTPYMHGTPAEAEIQRYRVEVPINGNFIVKPLTASESCESTQKSEPAVYCTRSAQRIR